MWDKQKRGQNAGAGASVIAHEIREPEKKSPGLSRLLFVFFIFYFG